jgi:hypothetical protein
MILYGWIPVRDYESSDIIEIAVCGGVVAAVHVTEFLSLIS